VQSHLIEFPSVNRLNIRNYV